MLLNEDIANASENMSLKNNRKDCDFYHDLPSLDSRLFAVVRYIIWRVLVKKRSFWMCNGQSLAHPPNDFPKAYMTVTLLNGKSFNADTSFFWIFYYYSSTGLQRRCEKYKMHKTKLLQNILSTKMERHCKDSTEKWNIWVHMWNSSQYSGEGTKSRN